MTRDRFALTLHAALCGCSSAYATVRVVDHGHDAPGALDEAGDMLGLDIVPDASAPVTLELVRVLDPAPGGLTKRFGPCDVFVRSPPFPLAIAHEMGHALGLGHVDTQGNLMTPSADGLEIETWQTDAMERRAWRMGLCR